MEYMEYKSICPVCKAKSKQKLPKNTYPGVKRLNLKCEKCHGRYLQIRDFVTFTAKKCDADALRYMALYALILLKEKDFDDFNYTLASIEKVKMKNLKNLESTLEKLK